MNVGIWCTYAFFLPDFSMFQQNQSFISSLRNYSFKFYPLGRILFSSSFIRFHFRLRWASLNYLFSLSHSVVLVSFEGSIQHATSNSLHVWITSRLDLLFHRSTVFFAFRWLLSSQCSSTIFFLYSNRN